MTPPGWGKTMGPCPTCEALARTVMLDQTSHDTKRQWQGLTAEEVFTLDRAAWKKLYGDKPGNHPWSPMLLYFYEGVEAKLKEKNT